MTQLIDDQTGRWKTTSKPGATIWAASMELSDEEREQLTTGVRIPMMKADTIKFNRTWAMASSDTFTIKPIRSLVKWYLSQSQVSVDPFARNNRWATYTNDLNPETQAEHHLTAIDFLTELKSKGVVADLVAFDPPYSRRQVMECYQGIGKDFENKDSQYFSVNWRDERSVVNSLLEPSGVVLSFGWHTNGMQQSGNYKIEQILLVAHGGAHNDTIVMVERKMPNQQLQMFVGEI